MSWELIVILVFISLMTDSIELVFHILTDQTFFFIEMFVFNLFAHFEMSILGLSFGSLYVLGSK